MLFRLSSSFVVAATLFVCAPLQVAAQSFQLGSFDPVAYGLPSDGIEVPSMRSYRAITFHFPDGHFIAVSDGIDLFTHDDHGQMIPIEESGHATSDGITFDRLPRDVHVTFDLARPSYLYRQGDHFFRMSFSGSAAATLESPKTVSYHLAEHVILRFTVQGAMVKKEITIDGPCDPTLLQFQVTQDPTLLQQSTSTGITLRQRDGSIVFQALAPSLQDTSDHVLDQRIVFTTLGSGVYAYDYDPNKLPDTYVIDPTTCTYQVPRIRGVNWANPDGARYLHAIDGAYATAVIDTGGGIPVLLGNSLKATDWGFNIPFARVDGVQVGIWRGIFANSPPSITDETVSLIVDGILVGQNKADVVNSWPSGIEYKLYGNSQDLWPDPPQNNTSLTTHQVNASNFGVHLSAQCTTPCVLENGGEIRVDQIRMQVSFTHVCISPTDGSVFYNTGALVYGYGGYLCTSYDPTISQTVYAGLGTGASLCAYNGCYIAPMVGTGMLASGVHAYVNGGTQQIDGLYWGWGWGRWGWGGWDGWWDGWWGSWWDSRWGGWGSLQGWWDWWNGWWGGWINTVKFRKGGYSGTKIADVPMQFYPYCGAWWNWNDNTFADSSGQKSLFHIATYGGYYGSGLTYTLYVPKSSSHDRVRLCSGKSTLGCTSSDSWSFLANDQGTIIQTNGGFDTSGIAVTVTGGYWVITGLTSTGGEGEDSGTGGTAIPEFSAVGFVLVLLGCFFVAGRWVLRRKVHLSWKALFQIPRNILYWFLSSDGAYVFFAYALTVAISFAATSKMFDKILGEDHLEIVNYSASPVEWLALVLAMCAFIRPRVQMESSKTKHAHAWLQTASLLSIGASVAAGFILLHPTDAAYTSLQDLLARYPLVGGPLLASLVAVLQVLPFFPAYVFIAPSMSSRKWKELLFIFATLVFCFLTTVFEALYFKPIAPFVLKILTKLLLLFSWNVYANIRYTILSVDGFRVVIGPACAGFGYILLFTFFFVYLVFSLSREHNIRVLRMIIAFVLGLVAVFLLNVLRIFSLMLVGRMNPHFALTLFHSFVGSVYFFLFFLLYFPLLRRWIVRKTHLR